MFASIMVNRSATAIDRPFDYEIPSYLENQVKLFSRVVVPFGMGNHPIVGIVMAIFDERPAIKGKIKKIKNVLEDEPFISDYQVDIANYIRDKTGATFFDCIKLFLPPVNLENIESYYEKIGEWEDEGLFKRGLLLENSLDETQKKRMKEFVESGLVRKAYKLKDEPSKKMEEVLVIVDNKKNGLTKLQVKVYDYLTQKEATRKEIMQDLKVSISPIKALITKGKARVVLKEKKFEEEKHKKYEKIQLNTDQKRVLDGIMNEYKKKVNHKFLIRGVTGSGKTEVYLQLVEQVLKEGRNAIILVPEIGLTPQTVSRFKGRFNEDIAIIHSRLNQTERFREWMKIKNGDVRIVVGARSAVFSPMKNVGIIIMDEEHDSSFVSSKSPKYNTADVAEYIISQNNGMLILGSATPSIVTYKEAMEGKFSLYELNKRANGKEMPDITVVNMRDELTNGNTSIFSLPLYEAMLKNLENKEQSMLFINRRGFSSLVLCRHCGEAIRCDHCDVSMTYHKKVKRLVCHYCGATKEVPTVCPVCGSKKIKEFGIGTEQVEEMTKKLFPNARVKRMDRDTTSRKNAHYDIWKDMNDGKIDILIGTQMIAKGLDFKNVTLVGILAADMMLKIPDYRASEWTFSLIRQVAGRAGRGDKKGKVILQTYKPEHYAIKASVSASFDDFMKKELEVRKEFKYPPYYNLILVRSKHSNNLQAYGYLKNMYDKIVVAAKKQGLKSQILYPNPSPISKVNSIYRWQFMIKVYKEELETVLSLLQGFDENIVSVDLDPINMM